MVICIAGRRDRRACLRVRPWPAAPSDRRILRTRFPRPRLHAGPVVCRQHSCPSWALGRVHARGSPGGKTCPCPVSGCTRTWIHGSSQQGAATAAAARGAPIPRIPPSACAIPAATSTRRPSATRASLRSPRLQRAPGPGRWRSRCRRSPRAAAAARAVRRVRGPKLAALDDKEVPCAAPGCTRASVFSRRGAADAPGAPEVESRAA